ncbi:hypothetical protein [Isoptericola sp. 178]|uniref:hypothetical protein n=1 Tax=Isoptericola sp. 178 TaxID=3064651 RepID=UPI002712D88F|nr:hypothetical protein [Isoptericola sp. 178]MDO8144522.1 hypothetical protein [Isoptericola sp. 178]
MTFGDRTFPFGRRLDVGPLAPFGDGIELAPLIDRLAAFNGAGSAWSIRLRRPLVRFSDDDAVQLRNKIATLVGPRNESPYTRWWLRHRG